jgi:lipoate-protein ligase B
VEFVRLPGLTPYAAALELQRDLLRRRHLDQTGDVLLLLEHEPVVTLGRNADAAGLLVAPDVLAAHGIGLHRVERGGQATYHGPGQLVGYPILRLADHGLGVRSYVARLEEVMIRAAAALGVAAFRVAGRPGIFTDRGKLGAVGVAVSRGVCFHGFAFNVDPDLSHFRFLVPCGLTDVRPASLAEHVRPPPDPARAEAALCEAFESACRVRLTPATPPGAFRPA